jgi:hypothetical protein
VEDNNETAASIRSKTGCFLLTRKRQNCIQVPKNFASSSPFSEGRKAAETRPEGLWEVRQLMPQ